MKLNSKTETIFALVESPSDKHQRHARRYIRQMSAANTPLCSTKVSGIHTAIQQMPAAHAPLFDKCQRYTPRYSTRSTCTDIYTYNARLRTHFRDTYIPTNLRFSLDSCRFRCMIFVLLLTCLAAFALTLLVCLFACCRKRNDRTRRGPILPLPSRWPSAKSCNNTCGQPHWAPPPPTP